VRLLSSDESIAPQNDNTFRILEEKHPVPQMDMDLDYPDSGPNLQATAIQVKNAILSFRNGSAGGIDGFHPQSFVTSCWMKKYHRASAPLSTEQILLL